MKFAVPKFLTFRDRDGYNKSAAQVVYPITPANGPWSGSNNLGQVVIFAPASNNVQSVLKMDEWGGPEMWTLSLGIEYEPFPIPNTLSGFDIIADILFGVGGATQSISCNWLQGTRLSLPMNTISVSARYVPTVIEGITTSIVPQPNLRLSAQIARGTCVGNAIITNRFTIDPQPPGGYDIRFPIPAFARSVELIAAYDRFATGVYGAMNVLQFSLSTPFGGAIAREYACDVLRRYEIPILPSDREIRYGATLASPVGDAILLWRLAQ